MRLHQIRNATVVLELGRERLLVDPVLGARGSFMGFKLFGGGRRRNPLVDLPENTAELLEGVTAVLLTHAQHADHLDAAGLAWIRERGLPVWTSALERRGLARRGLDARVLEDGSLGLSAEVVPVSHGRGVIGWLMGPVAGFYVASAGEPSVLLTSDAVLTDELLADIRRLRPDVIVAPAGAANFGLGGDILFSLEEQLTLAQAAPGHVVFNHLEALDHCPTTRAQLRERLELAGLTAKTSVPEDGASLDFEAVPVEEGRAVELRSGSCAGPGFRKRLVDRAAKWLS